MYTYDTRYYFRCLSVTKTEVMCRVQSKEGCLCGCGSKITLSARLKLSGDMEVGQYIRELMYHLKIQDNTQVKRWEI